RVQLPNRPSHSAETFFGTISTTDRVDAPLPTCRPLRLAEKRLPSKLEVRIGEWLGEIEPCVIDDRQRKPSLQSCNWRLGENGCDLRKGAFFQNDDLVSGGEAGLCHKLFPGEARRENLELSDGQRIVCVVGIEFLGLGPAHF